MEHGTVRNVYPARLKNNPAQISSPRGLIRSTDAHSRISKFLVAFGFHIRRYRSVGTFSFSLHLASGCVDSSNLLRESFGSRTCSNDRSRIPRSRYRFSKIISNYYATYILNYYTKRKLFIYLLILLYC